ncbi:MAG: hypothetical protein QNJ46_14735 [Leptolyngbyaceae cyanobacterium MO_188.B28]|nr:hypothetical protein [Leptolyngbyaceae cyanobacterium MO_188.B28]
MSAVFEAKAYTILTFAAILLLLLVTGSVFYLTAVEWRDRRRRDQDQPKRRSR